MGNLSVYICTDMEGLSGVDKWEQCYPADKSEEGYQMALRRLTCEANVAIRACFDAGVDRVLILDGHGVNKNSGFILEELDDRAERVYISSYDPIRFEGFDDSIDMAMMIGQHAMAGTLGGFLDHTSSPKNVCRLMVGDEECGELGMFTRYAGYHGAPLVYASGDEALCREAEDLVSGVVTTATKRGTSWSHCELYPNADVEKKMHEDIVKSIEKRSEIQVFEQPVPAKLSIEWAYTAQADRFTQPHVRRPHARIVEWDIHDPRDVYTWPPKG